MQGSQGAFEGNLENEEELTKEIYKMMTYKGKSLRLCCCDRVCTLKIPPGDYNYGVNLKNRVILITLIVFVLQEAFTLQDFIVTTNKLNTENSGYTTPSEILNFNILDILQISLTLGVMYLLTLHNQLA